MEAIDESSRIRKEVRFWAVGFKLVDQGGKLVDIFRHGTCLAYVEELAQKGFMLITAKVLMNQGIEGSPINGCKLVLDGLQPAFNGSREMHCRHPYPHGLFNSINLKVVRGTGDPKLSMVTIKFGKIEFREAAQLGGLEVGGRGGSSRGGRHWVNWLRQLVGSGWVVLDLEGKSTGG